MAYRCVDCWVVVDPLDGECDCFDALPDDDPNYWEALLRQADREILRASRLLFVPKLGDR